MLEFTQLKLTYDHIAAAISKGQEPLEELVTVRRYLQDLCNNHGELLQRSSAGQGPGESGLTADQIRYILEDFGPGLIKKMCRERSRDENYLEVCGAVLEGFLDLMLLELRARHFNQEFLFACRQIFDYECMLHKFNFQIPDEALQALYTKGSGQVWRNELQEGDMVDALLQFSDRNGAGRASGWSQARICKVEGDSLHLEYPTELRDTDRALHRWSVEIAPFESKTRETWEWRKTIKVYDQVDALDDTWKWLKATVIGIEDVDDHGRVVKMATIGMRIYVASGPRQDERGCYDGWGERFDEQIPLYSPRLSPFLSCSIKTTIEDEELDESLDDVMKPQEGHLRVWAVPRPRKCTSSEYLRHISVFCQNGGLDSILEVIENCEASDKPEGFNLCVLAILLSLISLPAVVYHKSVIAEYAPKLIAASKTRLLSAPARALRDVRREHIEAIVKAVDSLSRRVVEKDEREQQVEILKLEVALLCLNSSYMERRIQGIRDLNLIIKQNRVSSSKFTSQFLVEWMQTHGVFEVLFDAKKTHLQLIQRCDEILKLLLQEDMLSEELLQMFWSLTRTDLRLEVYKIISDCSFSFKQKHLDFLFDKIKHEVPPEKLGMEEFTCLSELGKYPKDKDACFQERVAQFFWDLIVSQDTKNLELIDNCIQKYRDMVRYWDLDKKQGMLARLKECLGDPTTPSIPVLKLLKGLIQDQSERVVSTSQSASAGISTTSAGSASITQAQGSSAYGGGGATGGSALRTRLPDSTKAAQEQPEGTTSAESGVVSIKRELTLQEILSGLLAGPKGLIGQLLNDLAHYYEAVHKHLDALKEQAASVDRHKLHVRGSLYSHHAEISERLQFIKFVAHVSQDYCISKKELGVIYDLMVTKSCIESDEQEFLTWCKSSCESQTAKSAILDLGEVGEFFTEKIACRELDVRSLAPVGFEFLQFYFISLNEREGNLLRQSPTQVSSKATAYPSYSSSAGRWTTSYSWTGNQGPASASKSEEQASSLGTVPTFTLQRLPSELRELDMLWTLVLECERPSVAPRVIDFLIKVHLSLREDLKQERLSVLQGLIDRCMAILQSEQGKDPRKSVRVIEILKTLVHVTEVKGTGDVLAHGALLKGEPLEPLRIRNRATLTGGELVVQVHSNNSLWDLRKEVSRALDLAPRYLQLSLGSGTSLTELKDIDNGKTIAALGLLGGEALTAQKLIVEEHIPNAPLVGSDGELTPAAARIFGEWYDRFCDAEGAFTRESAAHFIQACCGDLPAPSDARISALFQTYDGDSDGKIQREEFLSFYRTCSRGEKATTVRENLKAFNVRPDLKKMSEVEDESAPLASELPRHVMSKNQDHFDSLMKLLEVGDNRLALEAWELIQMLATNISFYRRVLQLDIAKRSDSQSVDWPRFFDRSSSFRLLYTIQIVQAVLEDGQDSSRRVSVLNIEEFPGGKGTTVQASTVAIGDHKVAHDNKMGESQLQLQKKSIQIANSVQEDTQLRAQWAEQFLLQGGFQYILRDFMECSLQLKADEVGAATQSVELKYVAFMLNLLRTFIMAAFSTRDADAYKAATLARRSSSVRANEGGELYEAEGSKEGSSFQQLQSLLEGPMGVEIVDFVDYSALQRQVLSVTNQVLKKDKLLFEDRLIVENALNLWVGCLLHRSDLFLEFMQPQDPNIKPNELLLAGLLFCPYETVREEFKQSLSTLCFKVRTKSAPGQLSPLDNTLKLLSSNFSLISEYPCKQYFELFCELIDNHFLEAKIGVAEQVIDSEALLSAVIDRIREENHKAQKARAEGQGAHVTDYEVKETAGLFQGLIKLAGKILDSNLEPQNSRKLATSKSGTQQRGLIDELFTRFLFPTVFDGGSDNTSRSLTMAQVIESREEKKTGTPGMENKSAAYKLLNSLLRRDPELMVYFFQKCIQPLMAHVERTDGWNYTPPSATERSQEYVGLRNLGCICYMNSMLQQFFMIPAFRYNLLCVEDGLPADLKEYKGELVDDNVLHQLQKLMANLELSERSDFNPWEFCFAFKEFDGSPTNTGEQKDAQEFLNLAFDRLENALKGTSRQYLLQSVFGGKTCSQLVCKECGKVKNRLEDFYNLSLTVKDIKGMHESLSKMVEGEVISDYECTGCKKKVDVSKRTLIAQTPNVLIVHLQRIIFNFDTFQNDKINQHFEFPQQLDLAPYSYYEVMRQENRLDQNKDSKEQVDGDQEDEEQPKQERKAETTNSNEENQEPPQEDCFEYKLVGVTVHSGTAHAGHYWSYINTCRGNKEGESNKSGEGSWANVEGDSWMEFNDSTVRDFQASKLKEECFGGDSGGSSGFGLSSLDGWGLSGGGYGKSGYMLFYERRTKKPLKLLGAKVQPTNGEQDIERHSFEVDYKQAVPTDDLPNALFLRVLEENRKFGFENDIYSQDFFDFVLTLQKDILSMSGGIEEQALQLRKSSLKLGSKVTMELLAKAYSNSCIDEHVAIFMKTLKADNTGELAHELLESWEREDGFDYLFALLLECPDSKARSSIASLLKYMLVILKLREKDFLLETEDYKIEGQNGEQLTIQRYKALSSRFVIQALDLLNSRVAKNWSRFDQFHDLLHFFALADQLDIEELIKSQEQAQDSNNTYKQLDQSSSGARVGLEFFFKVKYIQRASDFILGKKSPLCSASERRPELGGTYAHPDFSGVIKLLTAMITDQEFSAKFPMRQIEKQMILHPDLLKTMLGSATAGKQFGSCLANMCKDDAKLSRKVSKVFLRAIEQAHLDTVGGYLKALKPFLKSDDSLKLKKLEWVFGVPEVVSRKIYGASRCKYGIELVDRVNEEATKYASPVLFGAAGDEALLAQIIKCKGRFDVQCINCLEELLSLMKKDKVIARYIYHLPPPTYQSARFTDWFRPYLEEQLNDPSRASASSNQYFKHKYELLNKAIAHLDALQPVFDVFEMEQKQKLEQVLNGNSDSFMDLSSQWLGTISDEVIQHFPPQMIVGKQVSDDREVYIDDSNPLVRIEIFELDCEYAYSAPTGLFNLQVPNLQLRTSLYQTQSYEQYKQAQAASKYSSDAQEEIESSQESPLEPEKLLTKTWEDGKREGSILLKVIITNKTQDKDLKVWYRFGVKEGSKSAEAINVPLTLSSRKTYLYSKNQKIIETLMKIDPTKPFILDYNDLDIEVDAIVRNQEMNTYSNAGGKKVTHEIAVGNDDPQDQGNQSGGDYDEDDRDDDLAYNRYQSSTHYDGYVQTGEEESLMGLLNLQPQNLKKDGSTDKRSDDSTNAVQDADHNGSGGNTSARNSADLDDGQLQRCDNCGADNASTSFQCEVCGQFIGGHK